MKRIYNRGGNAVSMAKNIKPESLYPLRLFVVGRYRGNSNDHNNSFYRRNSGACVVGSMANMLFDGDTEDTHF